MRLVVARSTLRVEGAEELSVRSNYFIGNDPKKWRTDVRQYAKVKHTEVYPVDLVYYGNQRELEYDFIVAPGATSCLTFNLFDASPVDNIWRKNRGTSNF